MPKLKRPITTMFFATLIFLLTVVSTFVNNEHVQVSIFNKTLTPHSGVRIEPATRIDPEAYDSVDLASDKNVFMGKYGEWSYCEYDAPESPTYSVELQGVEVQEDIQPGDVFLVDITFKNTGNARLFSADSGCYDVPVLNLGTQKSQDRLSVLGSPENRISGWKSSTRVKMSDDYIDPEGTFHFQFQSLAPEGDNIYREYFQPVVENMAWIGESFAFDVPIGTPTEDMLSDISFVEEVSIAASELTGLERNLEIVLASQMGYARFGEITVWSLQISSGLPSLPTPKGNYTVLSKQELRIGQKWPHYYMPYFQLFTWRGHGLHALPYLMNDGGVFWKEALSDIGKPVSHGCVRQLPEDAITLYNFTSVGTPIWIH